LILPVSKARHSSRIARKCYKNRSHEQDNAGLTTALNQPSTK